MSKKLIAILALTLCLMFAFTACNGKQEPIGGDASATTVSSNGGFLVETGDYVYFINGSEVYTESNTLGSVEKADIVRVKKAELADLETAKKEVVVSKLVSTSDYAAGIYIYGDRIYFATPSDEKNKTGVVQNSDIEFCSAKLDGTDVKEIATASGSAGNGAAYRFVEVGGKVYVAFISEETVDEVTTKYINVVGEDGSEVKQEYETYVFDKGVNGDYVYYTTSIENETLGTTESFNAVYRLKIGATEPELILYGAGSDRNAQDGKTYVGKGVQGVKFTLIAAQNDNVYFSVAAVDTSVATHTFYTFMGETLAGDAEANFAALPKIYAGAKGATVYAATSIFQSPDCIVYLDATEGICSYNYTKNDDYNAYYGVTTEFYSSEVLTATISYVTSEYLYYNISGVYYRLPYANGHIAAGAEVEKLSPVTYSTAWYAPEAVKVGEKEYFFGTLSAADYFDYVVALEVMDEETLETLALDDAFGVKAFLETTILDEEDLADKLEELEETTYETFITGTARENVLYMWESVVSRVGETAKEEVDDYIETTYPVEEDTTSTSEDKGCSSAAGIVGAGAMLVVAAGVVLGKKRA